MTVVQFKDKRAVSENHPLYSTWKQMIKAQTAKRNVCERWLDFWNFTEDVKEKPDIASSFYRLDSKRPYGPDNYKWRLLTNSEEHRQQKAKWARDYRAKKKLEDPLFFKTGDLKKYFNIGLDEYNAMLEAQNHVCAICEGTEKSTAPDGGNRTLNVDHCHSTGAIRGLLCSRCNRALGFFGDNVTTLKRAIEYLGGKL